MRFAAGMRNALVDCEIYRNGNKVDIYQGLISDSKDYNMISFDPDTDIQIGDDIYCPLKKKHYIITNTDIALFQGKPHRLDAYFENNFKSPSNATVFNTYNPVNTIIGSQQKAILNINDCYNNLENQINNYEEDKEQLLELLQVLKNETSTNNIDKTKLSKFQSLLQKHGNWLIPSISQIIAAWVQRG